MNSRSTRRPMSVAGQLLILQLVVFIVVAIVAGTLVVVDERGDADDATRDAVTAVAVTTAQVPEVAVGLRSPDPTAALQPLAEKIRVATGVDFVVVVDPGGYRVTHPVLEQIGRPYTGHTEEARGGQPFSETYTGSLGPSIRTIAPVFDGGNLAGFVSVGVTRQHIAEDFLRGLPGIIGLVVAGLAVTALGGVLLARRLRRQTLGLNPDQLLRMYEHHDAVLRSIGEGLIVFGTPGGRSPRVDVINAEARRLLGFADDEPVEFGALPDTLRTLATGDDVRDEVHLTQDRVLVVGSDAVEWDGRRIGTVVTLRDHTELRGVLGELESVRGFAESLRAQAHESANRLHTIITMVELGRSEEAVEFATRELEVSQHLIDRLTSDVTDPALAALLLGKVDEARERGVDLTVTDETALGAVPLSSRDLVTLVGNLVDNAIDASRDADEPWVEVTVRQYDSMIIVEVADSGPGMSPDVLDRAMQRGYSTKSAQRGLGLALVAQTVTRHGGTLRTEPSLGAMIVAEIPIGEDT